MVNDWYYSFNDESTLSGADLKQLHNQVRERIRMRLDESISKLKAAEKRRNKFRQLAAAIVIPAVLTVGIYFFSKNNTGSAVTDPNSVAIVEDTIVPGGNKATLILADGRKIVLDSANAGIVGAEGGLQIIKPEDGAIVYKASTPNMQADKVLYNTIITPRGGQHRVTLPDGTKVWLNSASSLRYPIIPEGSSREVYLQGEGYFEVATALSETGNKKPFIVSVHTTRNDDMKVNVLGTKFNIMGYGDEEVVKTTLVEGRVELWHNSRHAAIVPGQQATLSKTDSGFMLAKADIRQALAWKNGEFRFEKMSIQGIMRQLSRWYEAEVEFKGNVEGAHLSGVFSRTDDIKQLLEVLETTGLVAFQIKGKKITVLSK
jgi:ferric-dicitrate binding protein FerR (iron transport regulator)